MSTFIQPEDLPATVGSGLGLTVAQMIEDAEAMAILAAPCLGGGALGASLGTVSIAITTGLLTVSAPTDLAVGDSVRLGAMTGAAPLVQGTTYFVESTPTSTTLTLAATLGGAAIVTTTAGSSISIQQWTQLTVPQSAALKAILRGAILRWNDAGSGAKSSVTTGPFSETIDTTVSRRGMFWPSEITSLQSICSDGLSGKVFSIDTVSFNGVHAATCSINFGAAYCSCGADIAGFPLWEQ
jgi:hypothetical protein